MHAIFLALLVMPWLAQLASVAVGDRNLTAKSWDHFQEILNCWTSPEGNWTHRPDLPPLYSKIYSNDAHLVTKIYTKCGPVSNRTGLDYVWTPPGCERPMYPFSYDSMCKVMRGRHLVLMGDSLSLHNYEAWLNAMGNRTVYGGRYDGHDPHHWAQPYRCGHGAPGFQIIFLSWNNVANRHHFSSLKTLNAEAKGMVIVANWGAFYQGNESVKAHMSEILHFVSHNLTQVTFLYRSSNMAHLNCDDHKVPDNVLHLPAAHPYHIRWWWDRFPYQNSIWHDYIAKHQPGKVFMNIMPMVSKRPDQHPINEDDCLHYCLPGPTDTWVVLTHSVLRLIDDLAASDAGAAEVPAIDSKQSTDADVLAVDKEKQIQELENKIQELNQALVEEKKKRKEQAAASGG